MLFSAINYRGVRLSGTTQNLWTMGSLAILAVFIVGGFASGRGDWGNFSAGMATAIPGSSFLGPAMIAVIFSYSGWFVTAYIGDEVKRPERNLPLSLILGTAMVTALYVAIITVYLYAMPVESLKGVVQRGTGVGERLLSKGFVRGLTLAIMLGRSAPSIKRHHPCRARLLRDRQGRPLPSPLGKASRPVRHSSRGPNCPGGIGLPLRCG